MDASGFVAIYAAVVATGALGWQVYSWRRARSNRVTVEARIGFLAFDSQPLEAIIITAYQPR